MPKLRKMLGDVNAPECVAMMRLIETQSKTTLAAWAAGYARQYYLPVYRAACPEDGRFAALLDRCEAVCRGEVKLTEIKPELRQAAQIPREMEGKADPAAVAAARAVATAFAVIQTPTNALGFLFYGAAAVAYSTAGLEKTAEEYNALAAEEFRRAQESLTAAAVPDEKKTAKINWNC